MSICEVKSCNSSQGNGRIFHRFPKDISIRRYWLTAVTCKSHEIKQRSVVCSKHFRAKDYYSGRKRLLPKAVPTLWLNRTGTRERKCNQISPVSKCGRGRSNIKSPERRLPKKTVAVLDSPVKVKVGVKPKLQRKDLPKIQLQSSKKNDLVKRTLKINCLEPVKTVTATKDKTKTAQAQTDKNFSNTSEMKTRHRSTNSKYMEYKMILKSKSKLKRRNAVGVRTKDRLPFSPKKTTKSSNVVNSVQTDLKCQKSIKLNQFDIKTNEISSNENTTYSKSQNKEIETKAAEVTKTLKRHTDSEVQVDEVERKIELVCQFTNPERNELIQGICSSITTKEVKMENGIMEGTKNISNIEEKIMEMQNKIKKLEEKSIRDEERIETFKKALIQQRKNDLKILMDERENELLLRMDLLYLDYDPERICLLCLLLVDKKTSLTSVFWPKKNQTLISLIKNAIGIQVNHEEGMPSGICNECLQQIKRVDWIRRRMLRSDSLIKKFFSMKKALNENNPGTSLSDGEIPAQEKLQFNDDLFEEELTDVLKIEDVFSLENSSETARIEQVCVKEEVLDDVDEITQLSLKPISLVACLQGSVRKAHKCRKCHTVFTNGWSMRNHFRYCNKTFQCSECSKRFWNERLFKLHKQRVESCICVEAQRFCYECQKVFRWKWQLVFHVLQHRPQQFELF